jgi:hypothetical protein
MYTYQKTQFAQIEFTSSLWTVAKQQKHDAECQDLISGTCHITLFSLLAPQYEAA